MDELVYQFKVALNPKTLRKQPVEKKPEEELTLKSIGDKFMSFFSSSNKAQERAEMMEQMKAP